MSINSAGFYEQLPAFQEFTTLTNDAHYQALPQDWYVVVSDIKGSTVAIEAGRYKDVNLIGAATIAAARNAMNGHNFPFTFGGDGATFAFHKQFVPVMSEAMAGVQHMSETTFGLGLRVGMVSIAELQATGATVEAAKYELVANQNIALFRGGGLTIAEEWIKQPDSKYLLPSSTKAVAKLDGLSCRWNAVSNIHGTVLSIIVSARGKSLNATYNHVLNQLNSICDNDLEASNPVNIPELSYQSIRECFYQEGRFYLPKWSGSHLLRIIEIIYCVMVFRIKMPALFFDAMRYTKSLRRHADYRKFDDVLRMVVDVSNEQKEQIYKLLETLHQNGDIYYGVHSSKTSLITCLVDSAQDGQHIHFVDGGDGGYAMAAKQLKQQIKAAN
ncbi:MAG: DUF3095 family protein [Opitutaceae bacterium]